MKRRRQMKNLQPTDRPNWTLFIKIHHIDNIPKYNYDKFVYINAHTKSIITCPIHGVFEQTPEKHKQGKKCPRCSKGYKFLQEDVLDRFKTVHRDKYDYSLITQYHSKGTKVQIICPIHGEFLQTPNSHLQEHGCEKCGLEKLSNLKKKTQEQFIKEAKEQNKSPEFIAACLAYAYNLSEKGFPVIFSIENSSFTRIRMVQRLICDFFNSIFLIGLCLIQICYKIEFWFVILP